MSTSEGIGGWDKVILLGRYTGESTVVYERSGGQALGTTCRPSSDPDTMEVSVDSRGGEVSVEDACHASGPRREVPDGTPRWRRP